MIAHASFFFCPVHFSLLVQVTSSGPGLCCLLFSVFAEWEDGDNVISYVHLILVLLIHFHGSKQHACYSRKIWTSRIKFVDLNLAL